MPKIEVDKHSMELSSNLRYLAKQIDTKLPFAHYIKRVTDKALTTAITLCKIMPYMKGPKQAR